MSIEDIILTLALSLFANFFSSASGGGTGIIQIPAILLLGYSFPEALLVHRLSIFFLGIGSSKKHSENFSFSLFNLKGVIIYGSIGVFIGSFLIIETSSEYLTLLFSIFVVIMAFYSVFEINLFNFRSYFIRNFSILIIGVANGLFTAGTGILLTSYLVKIMNYSFKKAISYTMFIVPIFWNLISVIVLLYYGIEVAFIPLLILIPSSLVGGYFGATFVLKAKTKTIKYLYLFTSLILVLKLSSQNILNLLA